MLDWLFGKSVWGRVELLERRLYEVEMRQEKLIRDILETQDMLETVSVDIFDLERKVKKKMTTKAKTSTDTLTKKVKKK